ncbi:MAG: hypothetical protein RMY36_017715 [Nostoc sp. SerVER01]|nr:hypothetical protein [Nostoc sp. DedQUE11]
MLLNSIGDRLSKIYEFMPQFVKILLNATVFQINSSCLFYLIDMTHRHHDLTLL